ncbi:MAG: hypothetical protein EXS51_01915 [Candidatus Taylorbacteria bacterium]|nr:hypothetical protein [Candidatus Taylorbacteria bacterium]
MGVSEEAKRNIRDRVASYKERRMGITKKKVLVLLGGGLSLALSGSPRTSWKIVGEMAKDWKELTKQTAERAINSLYASKLVGTEVSADGTFTLVLAEKGEKRILKYNLSRMKIEKPVVWDKLWRMISFDIPEDKREARNAIRGHLLHLGFYEQHQSFLIYPFECRNEMEYLIELYDVRKYVRFILATYIDNELEIKKFFSLERYD